MHRAPLERAMTTVLPFAARFAAFVSTLIAAPAWLWTIRWSNRRTVCKHKSPQDVIGWILMKSSIIKMGGGYPLLIMHCPTKTQASRTL